MAIIVSCPQEVKLFMLGALFCGCSAGAARGGERGWGLGLINNYALSLLFRLVSRLSFVLFSLSLSHSFTHSFSFSISHLFSSTAVTAATLRLICVDGPKHTGRRSLARNPVEWKLNQSLFVMSARPVCLFIPRGLCAGLARRRLDRTPDSPLTVSTAVCLY